MTKTTGKPRTETRAPETTESFDPPYAAHQVHTLVQVLFHKLSGGMHPNRPWGPATTGTVVSAPAAGPPAGMGSPSNPQSGFTTGTPPANYWYP